jgi:acyl-CoA dehydrogenase
MRTEYALGPSSAARGPEHRGYRVRRDVGQRLAFGAARRGVIVTLARTGAAVPGRGLSSASLLAIDAAAPGVRRIREQMLGWHAADVCKIDFEDVHVPADRLIGRPGKALMYLFEAPEFERLVAGLLALGGAAHCVELLIRHARTHRVKDAPLAANQAVRHRIADLTAELDLVRRTPITPRGYTAGAGSTRARLPSSSSGRPNSQ